MKQKIFEFNDLTIVAKQCGEEGGKYNADAQFSILEKRRNGKFHMIEGDAFLAYDLKDLTFEDVTMLLFDRVSERMIQRELWSRETAELAERKLAEVIGYEQTPRVHTFRYIASK